MIVPLQVNKLWVNRINIGEYNGDKSDEAATHHWPFFKIPEPFMRLGQFVGLEQQMVERLSFLSGHYQAKGDHFEKGPEI